MRCANFLNKSFYSQVKYVVLKNVKKKKIINTSKKYLKIQQTRKNQLLSFITKERYLPDKHDLFFERFFHEKMFSFLHATVNTKYKTCLTKGLGQYFITVGENTKIYPDTTPNLVCKIVIHLHIASLVMGMSLYLKLCIIVPRIYI